MAHRVILDVDPGIDDALAMLLALRSPELEVVGVTCVAGNVTIDLVARNALAILELAGSRVPVAVGARKPLVDELRTATFVHGSNGLGDIDVPPPTTSTVSEDAATFLTRTVREQRGAITVIALGPLTNLALAILRDPTFVINVASLVIMGGAVAHSGNATPAAEANFRNDPEAAAAVIESGARIQLVDLGATSQGILPVARVQSMSRPGLPPVAAFAVKLLDFYGRVNRAFGSPGAVLHDPLAVALTAMPDLAQWLPLHLTVETSGTHARGASIGTLAGVEGVVERQGDHWDLVGVRPRVANASLARSVHTARFLDLLLQRLEIV